MGGGPGSPMRSTTGSVANTSLGVELVCGGLLDVEPDRVGATRPDATHEEADVELALGVRLRLPGAGEGTLHPGSECLDLLVSDTGGHGEERGHEVDAIPEVG